MFRFKFGQSRLSLVPTYKYLAVIFDEDCNFDVAARTLGVVGGRAPGKLYTVKRKLNGIGFKMFTKL